MSGYTFYWSLVWDAWPELLSGVRLTVEITCLSVLFGTLLAMPLSVARQNGRGVAGKFSSAWIEVARNTPTLFQVYMMYFGVGALGINISSFASVLIALTFNNAGYLAEIFRGGLVAVPPQQLRAARSLGMSQWQAYRKVIFPQVFSHVFPAFINQAVWALLNSSLGMLIGLRELTGAANAAQSVSFRSFEFFLVTAGIYYVLAKAIEFGSKIVFRRALRT
ncbi:MULTISPECIES: amino acid ABC transporter permease [Paraburkholderia]|uniref:Amino acid ABC transporter membrane protein 1, PAAT family n=1 Tax=Paraburkholderia phenazinium TaxID=60549 RepID=A0A1N6GKH3_9BURK|nr:amino acid ABC transporter permease [Paraburkholderia phenazinium]SIO08058.1 amino acid ABC transporter membrane protein 1, PAAT family [Paraburkholderia phenazinium]